ncbi:MAG: isochorismatase family cysteine hydrolase [Candidatus Bathyarchaeia archaeon]
MCKSDEFPALFVIDMQNAFLHENGYLARSGKNIKPYKTIVGSVQRLVRTMRENGFPIIYFRHAYRKGYIDGGILINELFPNDKLTQAWLDGSWDTEIYSALKPEKEDIVIKKNRYSGFWGTDLDQLLRNLKVNAVIITGIHTNVCCDSTARDAAYRDYRVYFVSDATATNNDALHQATLETMRRYFGIVLTTEEMIEHIKMLKKKGGESARKTTKLNKKL